MAFMKISNINYRALFIDLSKGFGIALLLSLFIYSEYYNVSNTFINTLSALIGFYFLLIVNPRTLFATGGFVGLLWFYWIGYSFEYYHVGWMTPFISLFFVILYALFFGVVGITQNPLYRAVILFGLSYVEPMDWNWLQLELPFVNTYFGVEKWQFATIIATLGLFIYLSRLHRDKPYHYGVLIFLAAALNYSSPQLQEANLKIKLYAPTLLQEKKWVKSNRPKIIQDNMKEIRNAIKEHYDLIVLPESAFPLFLNRDAKLLNRLKRYSKSIEIITGALYVEDHLHYNVSYHFAQGKVTIAKKLVLVPFGEYIPLPEFLRSWVNETFFDGASDFVTATKPTDFKVKGVTFRNAICYEATCEEIYEGDPAYVIATSNNGWFYPSIEPTLQKLLMKYYAKKHHTIIYHSANMGGTGIIHP